MSYKFLRGALTGAVGAGIAVDSLSASYAASVKSLIVNGASGYGQIGITGDADLLKLESSALSVMGSVSGSGNAQFGGSLNVGDSDFTVDAGGNITDVGDITGDGDLTMASITMSEFTVDSSGNTDIDGTLNVEGVPTFQSNIVALGISGSGNAQFGGSLSIADGDFDVDAGGNITDVGDITGDGDLTMASITMAEFTVASNGNTDIDGTLNVEGVPTFQSNIVAVGISGSGNAQFGGSLSIADGDFDVDAGGNITDVGNIDGDGDLTMASITMTGFGVDADGDTQAKSLTATNGAVSGSSNFLVGGALAIKQASGSADANKYVFVGEDTAAGLKLSFRNDSGQKQAIVGVTGTDTQQELRLEGAAVGNILAKLGDAGGANEFRINDSSEAVQFSVDSDGEVMMKASAADPTLTADGILYQDADGSIIKKLTFSDYATDLAGATETTGLAASSGVLTVDIANLGDLNADIVDGDLFMIDDGGGGTLKKTAASRLKTYIQEGSGDSLSVTALGDANATLVVGVNYPTGAISAQRTWTLPASPDVGDVVYVKSDENVGTTASKQIVISKAGSQVIDNDLTSITLQSPNSSVGLVYVAANEWRII